MKKKLVCTQVDNPRYNPHLHSDEVKYNYHVVQLIGITRPFVGEYLDENQINELIASRVEVVINPVK